MGIWGAIALGALVLFLILRSGKYSLSFLAVADVLAPGLLIAQAIGRFGNWFNAELFGSPTSLPWGLKIPYGSRPEGFQDFATFHPTFLYESIWCCAAAILLLKSERVARWISPVPGQSFLAYISMYTLGRLWIESLRIDPAHHIFGVRINILVALVIFATSTTALIRRRRNFAPLNPASVQEE
jgi:prolipoprotein diacylglyceryl transferase